MFEGPKSGLLTSGIRIIKYYRDANYVSVWIGSGVKGWFYVYGMDIKKFKEKDGDLEENFNEAYAEVVAEFGNIEEMNTVDKRCIDYMEGDIIENILNAKGVILNKSGEKTKKEENSIICKGGYINTSLLPSETMISDVYIGDNNVLIYIGAGEVGWSIIYGFRETITERRASTAKVNFDLAVEAAKKYGNIQSYYSFLCNR